MSLRVAGITQQGGVSIKVSRILNILLLLTIIAGVYFVTQANTKFEATRNQYVRLTAKVGRLPLFRMHFHKPQGNGSTSAPDEPYHGVLLWIERKQ